MDISAAAYTWEWALSTRPIIARKPAQSTTLSGITELSLWLFCGSDDKSLNSTPCLAVIRLKYNVLEKTSCLRRSTQSNRESQCFDKIVHGCLDSAQLAIKIVSTL